jgi:predicted GH43/DUF377 family glycosyl hydrolase
MLSNFKFARFSVPAFIIIALLLLNAVLPILTPLVHSAGLNSGVYALSKYSGNPVMKLSQRTDQAWAFCSIVQNGSTYCAYGSYHNQSTGYWVIGLMTSTDGIHWTEDTADDPVLSPGASGTFDSVMLWCPIVWKEGSTWYMLYAGSNSTTNQQNYIGLATSTNGVSWTKQNSGNPVFSGGGWCANDVEPWGLIKISSTYYLWFSTLNNVPRSLGFATSTNLMSWTADANNPIFPGASGTAGVYCACPFTYNGSYYLLVTEDPGSVGEGGVDRINLYWSATPTFYSGARTFLGTAISCGGSSDWDGQYVDTPFVYTANVSRTVPLGSTLDIYYTGEAVGGGAATDFTGLVTGAADVVLSPEVPLSGWQEDPLYTNASYVLSSSSSSLYLELDAVNASSKVAIFNLNSPRLSLSDYTYVTATVTGTQNFRILLRFFLDDGSSFDVVYWGTPATLNGLRFDLNPYAGRTLTGLVYVALMSSDGTTANITITQIAFGTQALQPLVPLSGWQEDPLYSNAPYVLSSTASGLFFQVNATGTSDKVAIFNLNTPKLKLSSYTYLNATVTGTSNARILLRFFLDDGSSFDVVYWESPATLNAVKFDPSPYAGRTLTGLVYVALMSSDGNTANITITQVAFATQALPPSVPLSGWLEDPAYTTTTSYVLTSTMSSLYLELDATSTSDKVAIFNLNTPKLKLSSYTYLNATVSGSANARILLRFFLDDGSSFDVVYWGSPATLNVTRFDLSPYAGRTLTGLVYIGLMSSDGTPANINITQIAFATQALQPLVPLSGWQEDPQYTNATYVLSSSTLSLYLQLNAVDNSSKVAIFNLNTPKLRLSDYSSVNVTVTGTSNARILLRFFLDDGSSFDVVRSQSGGHPVWISPADLNGWLFDLGPYAGRTLTGLVYIGLMSSDGATANITITQITFTHV